MSIQTIENETSTTLLQGANLRLKRAKELLHVLHLETDRFSTRYPVSFQTAWNSKGTELVVKAEIPAQPDITWGWGIKIGEILYNARSALDQAISALLATDNHDQEFPIFYDSKLYYDKGRKGGIYKTRGIKPEAVKIIESHQPFKLVDANAAIVKRHPLWLLHEFNNKDKHRSLHVIFETVFHGSNSVKRPSASLKVVSQKSTVVDNSLVVTTKFNGPVAQDDFSPLLIPMLLLEEEGKYPSPVPLPRHYFDTIGAILTEVESILNELSATI